MTMTKHRLHADTFTWLKLGEHPPATKGIQHVNISIKTSLSMTAGAQLFGQAEKSTLPTLPCNSVTSHTILNHIARIRLFPVAHHKLLMHLSGVVVALDWTRVDNN